MKTIFSPSSRKGQSIVEAMVALSILMIGLMGVLTLLSRSLFLQRVTGDQAKATYLASEGIEIAKSLIDHDVYLGAANGGGWEQCFSSSLVGYDLDYTSKNCPSPPNFTNDPLYLDPGTGLYYTAVDAPAGATRTNFVRKVTVTSKDVNEIDVQSTVTWDTGVIVGQSVTLEDHFYNWHP